MLTAAESVALMPAKEHLKLYYPGRTNALLYETESLLEISPATSTHRFNLHGNPLFGQASGRYFDGVPRDDYKFTTSTWNTLNITAMAWVHTGDVVVKMHLT